MENSDKIWFEIWSHLRFIEQAHGISISNIHTVTGWIADHTSDHRLILSIALSLNHWVAVNHKEGEVEVPRRVFDQIAETVR